MRDKIDLEKLKDSWRGSLAHNITEFCVDFLIENNKISHKFPIDQLDLHQRMIIADEMKNMKCNVNEKAVKVFKNVSFVEKKTMYFEMNRKAYDDIKKDKEND